METTILRSYKGRAHTMEFDHKGPVVRAGHPHSSRRFDCVAGILRTLAAYSSNGTAVAASLEADEDAGTGAFGRVIRPALRGQTLSLPLDA